MLPFWQVLLEKSLAHLTFIIYDMTPVLTLGAPSYCIHNMEARACAPCTDSCNSDRRTFPARLRSYITGDAAHRPSDTLGQVSSGMLFG